MDEIERQFQRALGTFDHYIVVLEIAHRADLSRTRTEVVEAGNEADAFEEAVRLHMEKNCTVRRDQITLDSCHKSKLFN